MINTLNLQGIFVFWHVFQRLYLFYFEALPCSNGGLARINRMFSNSSDSLCFVSIDANLQGIIMLGMPSCTELYILLQLNIRCTDFWISMGLSARIPWQLRLPCKRFAVAVRSDPPLAPRTSALPVGGTRCALLPRGACG